MLWSKLFIPTLRDDHPSLIRAGYMRKHDYLFLGRRALSKIVAMIRQEFLAIGGQEFLAVSHAALALHAREIRGPKQLPQIWFQFQGLTVEAIGFGDEPFAEILRRVLERCAVTAPLRSRLGNIEEIRATADREPELLHTPNQKTIADIAAFTGLPETAQMKTVVMTADGTVVMALLRGDHQLDEAKLKLALLATELRPANADEIRKAFGADAGSLGPVGLSDIAILCDEALQGRRNLICGANRNDYHLVNVTPGEDFEARYFDLRADADASFALRTRAYCADAELFTLSPGRLLEAAVEQNRDADGIVLPPAIAPFEVVITPVNITDDAQREAAQRTHEQCTDAGLDALFDDRDERPGVKFKDSDLIGIPYRVTIGKKLPQGVVELVTRRGRISTDTPIGEVVASLQARLSSTQE